MTNYRCTRFAFACLFAAPLAATACSSDNNNIPDFGIKPHDAGTHTDGGGNNDSGNNTGADAQNGVDATQTGMDANQTGMDANQTGMDANQTGMDANQTGMDATAGMDATPGMGCRMNSDCTMISAQAVCIFFDMASGSDKQCNGTCPMGMTGCAVPCDWNASASTCANNGVCTWAGPMSDIPQGGVCNNDGMGGKQAQACTATFDAMGNLTMDDCDHAQNFFCIGANAQAPMGECSKLCKFAGGAGGALCSSLMGAPYDCVQADMAGQIGLCLRPPETYTDNGLPCPAAGAMCMGMNCANVAMLTPAAGECASKCDGLNQCPTNSLCLNTTPPACFFKCTPTCAQPMGMTCSAASAACSARNAGTPNCLNVGPMGTMTDGVCSL
jgi:hypothetical protein